MTSRTDTLEQIRRRIDTKLPDFPKIQQAADDLTACAPRFREAVARLMDARPSALGAASYDGPLTTGGGGTSSTERLAVPDHPTADPSARDRIKLDKALRELDLQTRLPNARERWICIHAETVMRIVNAWAPAEATVSQSDAAAVRLDVNDRTCQHCTPHRAKGHAERILYTGTVSGNLKDPIGLCRWCYDLVGRAGRLPLKSEIQRKDNGERVMVKVQTKC